MNRYEKTLVINVFGGPGARKSTCANSIFSELKWEGIDCEYSPEYAKEKVWAESFGELEDQLYIFAKQQHRLFRLRNKVQMIVADSPILLSIYYGEKRMTEAFFNLVEEQNAMYDCFNIFLERSKESQDNYQENGRMQSLEESKEIDLKIKKILEDRNIPYVTFMNRKEEIPNMVKSVIDHYKQLK
jgi:hypothetical protein